MFLLEMGKTGFYVTKGYGLSKDLTKACKFETKREAYVCWIRGLDWTGLRIKEVKNAVELPANLSNAAAS